MKRYASSLDGIALGAPWFVLAISVLSISAVFFGVRTQPDIEQSGKIVLSLVMTIPVILLPGIVIAMYLYKTTSIVVDENAITIERKMKPVVISFNDISSVKRVEDMKFAIRTFGNGGVFGYTGMYYKKGIGSMRWYCTQRKNYILIEKTNGNKIVITPDDADGFMKDVEDRNPALCNA